MCIKTLCVYKDVVCVYIQLTCSVVYILEKCAASVCTNKRSVLALLKVINYLRMQKIAAQRSDFFIH